MRDLASVVVASIAGVGISIVSAIAASLVFVSCGSPAHVLDGTQWELVRIVTAGKARDVQPGITVSFFSSESTVTLDCWDDEMMTTIIDSNPDGQSGEMYFMPVIMGDVPVKHCPALADPAAITTNLVAAMRTFELVDGQLHTGPPTGSDIETTWRQID